MDANRSFLYRGGCYLRVGIGHLIPTRNIVSGFGNLSPDNRLILTMEWLAEGLTLCFLGILVILLAFVAGPDHPATSLVARACAAMLVVMTILSWLTDARTSILPMKLCPYIKTTVAIIYVVATVL